MSELSLCWGGQRACREGFPERPQENWQKQMSRWVGGWRTGWHFHQKSARMAPANAECLLHARPCAKVVCCPTTQELSLLMPSSRGQLRHRQDSDLQEVVEQLRWWAGPRTQNIPLQRLSELWAAWPQGAWEDPEGKKERLIKLLSSAVHDSIRDLECHAFNYSTSKVVGQARGRRRTTEDWNTGYSLWPDFSALLIAPLSHHKSPFRSL